MRALLLLPLLTASACVTVDGSHREETERLVGTHCTPGGPVASLDTNGGDQIRLVFDHADPCTETIEVESAERGTRRLAKPVSVAVGVLAGAGLILGVGALFMDHTPKGPSPLSASTTSAVGEVAGKLLVFPVVGVGALAFAAVDSIKLTTTSDVRTERIERGISPQLRRVADGTVSATGLAPRKLVHGVLELSLEEAVAVALQGIVFLDGEPIKTPRELSWLLACQEALDPAFSLERRFRQARSCQDGGWVLADSVLRLGTMLPPADVPGRTTPR